MQLNGTGFVVLLKIHHIFSLLTIHFFIHSKSNNQSNYDEKNIVYRSGQIGFQCG